MKRLGTVITAAATLGLAALAYAQTSPTPGKPDDSNTPTRSSQFAALVPSDMSATEACSGFKSTTECAVALHAAHNVGIPFKDLKTRMTRGETLGAAIHHLKPGADVRAEVSRAEEQARADVRAPQD
jgi:hypothetical protein